MKPLIALSRAGWIRTVFRGLQLHRLLNLWLRWFPRERKLGNIRYCSTNTEGVSLALEMLEGGDIYDHRLLPKNVATFADLGCNVGYFACWLAHHAGRDIRGLMVDGNPKVLKEAKWHIAVNELDAKICWGVVGVDAATSDFWIYQSNTCSTAQLVPLHDPYRHRFQKIQVPVVRLGDEWNLLMGDAPCDVLKIDIEGCELDFLKLERSFLSRVDTIYVEWHKYRVTFEELLECLQGQGFKFIKVIEDIGLNGTACFKRVRG